MRLFCIFLLSYLPSLYTYAQVMYVKSNQSTSNIFNAVVGKSDGGIYVGNGVDDGHINQFIKNRSQILKYDNSLTLIDSVETNDYITLSRIYTYENNVYLIGDTLTDSVNFRRSIYLAQYDTNLNVLKTVVFRSQFADSRLLSCSIDINGNIIILSSHSTNLINSFFQLTKLDANLDEIFSQNLLASNTTGPTEYSMAINNGTIHILGLITQNEPVMGPYIQLNTYDSNFVHLDYFNFDSIGSYNNQFVTTVIGTEMYANIHCVSPSKLFVTSSFLIGKSTSAQQIKLDRDIVSAFYNPISHEQSLSRVYDVPDTNDYGSPYPFSDLIGDKIYIAATSNYRPAWNNPIFLDRPTNINLTRLDTNNNIVWQKTFGGDANYYMYNAVTTADSGVVLVGSRYDSLYMPSPYIRDGFIIKVDKNGNTNNIGFKEQHELVNLTIYPNPSSEQFIFKSENKSIEEIKVYYLNGKLCLSTKYKSKEAKINSSALSPATYVYSIKLEGTKQVVTGKIIITN